MPYKRVNSSFSQYKAITNSPLSYHPGILRRVNKQELALLILIRAKQFTQNGR
jgi:hypothetical protein